MNKKLLSVFALAALTLTACGEAIQPSESVQPSTPVESADSTPTTPSTPAESVDSTSVAPSTPVESTPEVPSTSEEISTPAAETYVVMVQETPNVTVTPSAERAEEGTTINLNVVVDNGYILDKITVNGAEISGTSFKMPADSAIIKAYVSLIDNTGIVLTGDISAKLVDENGDGVYVARNVNVANLCHVAYSINGEELTLMKVNNSKSFANLSIPGSKYKTGFMINGNATYDFYYDSNSTDNPCYVVRTKVNSLPTNENMFADLLQGSLRSESTVYPQNVNGVVFSDEVGNTKYEWTKYSDNSSYAKVTNLTGTKSKGLVYKAQVGDVYKVVNTYVDPLSANARDKRAKQDSLDTIAFSGQFDIVSAYTAGSSKYQYLQSEVDIEANRYSYDVEDLEYMMYQAHRNGYVGNIFNDVDVYSDTTVTSTYVGDDGKFEVEILTWVKWQNSNHYDEKNAYKTFKEKILFNADGSIDNGTYTACTYDEKTYDFSTNKLTAAADSVEPDVDVAFAYTYGAPKAGQPDVDITPYFISSIDNVKVQGKNSNEGNIGISEEIKCVELSKIETTKDYNMAYDYAPATALDAWQYGTVATSDPTVISKKSSNDPYTFVGVGKGTSDITIGNHTSTGVKKSVAVNVAADAFIRSIFMYTVGGYPDYNETFFASQGYPVAGRVYELQLSGSTVTGGYQMSNLNCTFEIPEEYKDIVKVSYDNSTGRVTFDLRGATNITSVVTVKINIVSPYIVADRVGFSTITLMIQPGQSTPTTLAGTKWTEENSNPDRLAFTEAGGQITIDNVVYTFTYTYDASSGEIKGKVVKVNDAAIKAGTSYSMAFTWDGAQLGVAILKETQNWDSYELDYDFICGGGDYDDDGVVVINRYEFFDLAA